MKSTSRKVAKKKQLTIAVNAALCLLTAPLMVASHTTQAQEPVVISVSGDNSFIFLTESEYPDGGELIIEESGSVEVIDHTSFDGTSVWNVTIDGIVRGYIYGIDEYESITLENGGSVTVSATGQSSPIELRDGGTVVNNGLIEGLITGDDSNGTSAIISNSGRDGDGTGESFSLENNGTIRVLRNIAVISGGLDEVEIVNNGTIEVEAPSAVGLVPRTINAAFLGGGAVSTNITNNGTIDVGFDSILDSGASVAIVDVNAIYDPELQEFTLSAPTGTTTVVNAEGATIRGAQIFDNRGANDGNGATNEWIVRFINGGQELYPPQTGGAAAYQLEFTNNGTLIASGAEGNYSYSVYYSGAVNAGGAINFTNTGSITVDGSLHPYGYGSGVFLTHSTNGVADQVLNFTNTADGVIQFSTGAIVTDGGVINNEGVIEHTSSDSGWAAIFAGSSSEQTGNRVEINNSGSISHAGVAIYNGLGVNDLVVNNSGTISGGGHAIFLGINGLSVDSQLNLANELSGTINGSIYSTWSTGNDFIDNRGTINGSISLGSGDDTVILSGSVSGDIDLGEDDDSLVLDTGATTGGIVHGGLGTDTLTLRGTGTLDTINYSDFEIGQFEGDDWTVNGAVDLSEINLISGILRFNGTVLTNRLDIATGAQLIATEIYGDVTNAGAFSVGGNGILASGVINGNFVNNADSVLMFDALDNGLSDSLVITGTATLEGGELMTLSNDAAWSVARDYTVLSAQEGLSGQFAEVTSNLEYLTPTLSYTSTDVLLSLTRRDAEIQNDILETTNTQQLSVANRVVPSMIQNQVGKQLLVNFSSSSAVASLSHGSLATGVSAGDETEGSRNVWINLTPTRYDRDAFLPGSDDRQNIDGESINFMLGADMTVGSRGVIGVFAGYEDTELDIASIAGRQDTDGFMFGAYAGVAMSDWLFASANGYWASLSTTLEEQAFGIPEVQVAEYDSDRYGLGVDLTAVKNVDAWSLTGQVAYTYTNESYDSYMTEVGDMVDLEGLSLGRFSVGAEVGYAGEVFTPYVSVNYESDTSVDQTDYDDNGTVLSAGLRAVTERLFFDAFVSTLQGRDNEDLTMVGLNISYAL